MTIEGPALRLTILVGKDDTWHHRPLYHEIVHRPHHPAALAVRGPARRGHHRRPGGHGVGLPAAARRAGRRGLVMVDPVEVIRYVGRPA
jgi:hypothetical protein